jgi:hypothetical protein
MRQAGEENLAATLAAARRQARSRPAERFQCLLRAMRYQFGVPRASFAGAELLQP